MKPLNQFLDGATINNSNQVLWNLTAPELVTETILTNQGVLSESGALVCGMDEFTVRLLQDKFIVNDNLTEETIWWGDANNKLSQDSFVSIYQRIRSYLSEKKLFVNEVYACASEKYKIQLHVVTEYPWHSLFVHNLFFHPTIIELEEFKADWTILCAPGFKADPRTDGTNSANFTIINFSEKIILIGGTACTSEIKNSVFTVLNYILPQSKGVLPMHCSANIGDNGDTAIFLGSSGTGKTTLSFDPARKLIGDDEHGWDKDSIFSFEGGCSTKYMNLSKEDPGIFRAIQFGTLLENKCATYPIHYMGNIVKSSIGKFPRNIFFLTVDAFGVLPPISKLNVSQAMYYFISGYTTKIVATETGAIEPEMTFSACFAKHFLPLDPTQYATILGEKLKKERVNIWLVNTGWTGGSYGFGKRIELKYTRALISAGLNGNLDKAFYQTHRIFGLQMPMSCPGVFNRILNPENAWTDKNAYAATAKKVSAAFQMNFKQYEDFADKKIGDGGPLLPK